MKPGQRVRILKPHGNAVFYKTGATGTMVMENHIGVLVQFDGGEYKHAPAPRWWVAPMSLEEI